MLYKEPSEGPFCFCGPFFVLLQSQVHQEQEPMELLAESTRQPMMTALSRVT